MDQLCKVLVVEDEPFIAKSLSFALTSPDRSVATAGNGREALALIAAEPPFDVIITDHNMPKMTGLELVHHLRAGCFAGRILVLSAHLTEENQRAYTALKVDGMIAKPFDLLSLRATVDALAPAGALSVSRSRHSA